MEKIINTYEASAADGVAVTIYEVQDMDDAAQPAPGGLAARRMQLSDGRVLTMVGDREFRIAGTDEVFLLDRPYSP